MATHLLRRVLGSRSSQILSATSSNPNSALTVARAYSVDTTPIRATLFPGDGIGPEIAQSVKKVFSLCLRFEISRNKHRLSFLCFPFIYLQIVCSFD